MVAPLFLIWACLLVNQQSQTAATPAGDERLYPPKDHEYAIPEVRKFVESIGANRCKVGSLKIVSGGFDWSSYRLQFEGGRAHFDKNTRTLRSISIDNSYVKKTLWARSRAESREIVRKTCLRVLGPNLPIIRLVSYAKNQYRYELNYEKSGFPYAEELQGRATIKENDLAVCYMRKPLHPKGFLPFNNPMTEEQAKAKAIQTANEFATAEWRIRHEKGPQWTLHDDPFLALFSDYKDFRSANELNDVKNGIAQLAYYFVLDTRTYGYRNDSKISKRDPATNSSQTMFLLIDACSGKPIYVWLM